MAVTMILDRVAAAHDLARKLRTLLDMPANTEESGLGAVLIEQGEHFRGHRGLRTIVDTECDLAAALSRRWHVRPIGAEQRAARPQTGRRKLQMIDNHGAECPRPKPRTRERQRRSATNTTSRGFE